MPDITLCCTSSGRHKHHHRGTTTRYMEVEHGMKLKEARIKAGFGRLHASKRIGIDKPQLYRYEAGLVRPGIEAVMRISRGLGLGDPWQIEEFRPALEHAKSVGLVAQASKYGLGNDQKEQV